MTRTKQFILHDKLACYLLHVDNKDTAQGLWTTTVEHQYRTYHTMMFYLCHFVQTFFLQVISVSYSGLTDIKWQMLILAEVNSFFLLTNDI